MSTVIFTLILFFVFYNFSSVKPQQSQESIPLVPALYVFGDSTVDGGNSFQVYPFGIDLTDAAMPKRCTNGKTIADFIATFLRLPIVPPYANMILAEKSKTGVNYASAGCGILPETRWMTFCLEFDRQLVNFNSTVTNNLSKIFDKQDLDQHLKNSIFLISFGINDFSYSYLRNGSKFSNKKPDEFASHLLEELAKRLKKLYGLGARKFLVKNIWPLGCAPDNVNHSDPLADGCNDTINGKINPYKDNFPVKLEELRHHLSGSIFSHSNDLEFVIDLKKNPSRYGITNTTGRCAPENGSVCINRDEYLYFDYVHTTEAANQVFSLNCFNGTLCSPLNIMQLLEAN